jgi:SAM-dependent methyltransferase
MNAYCIKDEYVSRNSVRFFDDTPYKDEHQREVYEKALALAVSAGCGRVLDIGCGSGYKLVKYFGSDFEICGYDLPQTVVFLQKTYPEHTWRTVNLEQEGLHAKTDLLLCVDVIEHVLDPNALLFNLRDVDFRFGIITSPDREKIPGGSVDGPPANACHVREWNLAEYVQYISRHFDVVESGMLGIYTMFCVVEKKR